MSKRSGIVKERLRMRCGRIWCIWSLIQKITQFSCRGTSCFICFSLANGELHYFDWSAFSVDLSRRIQRSRIQNLKVAQHSGIGKVERNNTVTVVFPQIALAIGVLTSSIRVRVRRFCGFVLGGGCRAGCRLRCRLNVCVWVRVRKFWFVLGGG